MKKNDFNILIGTPFLGHRNEVFYIQSYAQWVVNVLFQNKILVLSKLYN